MREYLYSFKCSVYSYTVTEIKRAQFEVRWLDGALTDDVHLGKDPGVAMAELNSLGSPRAKHCRWASTDPIIPGFIISPGTLKPTNTQELKCLAD